MEKIFERFYTDRPHQGFGQNSGLGLSISKQIVEAHGGRIWAENRQHAATGPGEPPRCSARASSCGCRRRDGRRTPTVHASAVLVGARAVLIRGPAGAGKSRLAFALIQAARNGAAARSLVWSADDRVHLEARHGRLLVRPAAGAGRIDRSARARHPPARL